MSPRHSASTVSSRGRNATAVAIALAAVGALYFSFDPVTAGTDPQAESVDLAQFAASEPPPPAMPEGPDDETSSAEETTSKEGTSETDGSAQEEPQVITGRTALTMYVLLLEKGLRKLEDCPGYTATFFKRERVDGDLQEGQVIKLKLRHDPFSIYMKWLVGDKGRELLYVEGRNDGNIVVHAGGWKARLLPALKLDPKGSLAMKESRYPVTKLGLRNLCDELIRYRKRDLKHAGQVRCRMAPDHQWNEKDCWAFTINYESRDVSELYRKSIVYIAKETALPVFVKNYAWSDLAKELPPEKLEEKTLIEHYCYKDIRLKTRLADKDFDRGNESYQFRR